jgi:hypothetical protein
VKRKEEDAGICTQARLEGFYETLPECTIRFKRGTLVPITKTGLSLYGRLYKGESKNC